MIIIIKGSCRGPLLNDYQFSLESENIPWFALKIFEIQIPFAEMGFHNFVLNLRFNFLVVGNPNKINSGLKIFCSTHLFCFVLF